MSEETRRILTNTEVIAVDQDPLGIQGFKYSDDGDLEIWFKPLADEDWAMCILNRGVTAREVEFSWQDEKVEDDFSNRKTLFGYRVYQLQNLWTGEDLGTTHHALKAEVPGHDVLMIRLNRQLGPSDH
jgi:alpha-galactosidase